MPTYKIINRRMLLLWCEDLMENLKQLKISYNIYALAYFMLSLYEYCQVFSKLELEQVDSLENVKLTVKDIKNYMSDDYREHMNKFKFIRDNLGHGYADNSIISISIVLLSDIKFQKALYKIFDTNFITVLRDTLESITENDNDTVNAILNKYRQQYGFTDNDEWEKECSRLKQLFKATSDAELAECIGYLLRE